MKKKQKKHLKWRMLKNISLVLTVSMVISTFAGYLYFDGVVREQKISDERVRLQQLTNQLGFMTEDIQRFAESIIVDQTLQELLEERAFESEFDRQNNSNSIVGRLVFYNSLRTYIGGSVLKMVDGSCYGSNYSILDEGNVSRKLETEEIAEYIEDSRAVYSAPYPLTEGEEETPVICFQVQMWDRYQFGKQQGTLYLEIFLDYFLKQIRPYAQEYGNVCLTGDNQEILFEQDPGEIIANHIRTGGDFGKDGVLRIKEGYLISETVENSGWRLCTFITSEFLRQRSRFVLEFFLISFLLSLGLVLIFTSRIMENMIAPVTRLSKQMEGMEYGKFDMIEMAETGDEIQTLYEGFGHMLGEMRKGEEERMRYEKQKKEMEFDIMLSQINPHYLYNVLNTVVYLAAAEKNGKIVEIVNSLIYTLQETLNVGEHSVETTIQKELELTKCYLNIQKYRYPDMFSTVIQCEEELRNCLVPKTIIEPLVENAILHGIFPKEEKGTISIRIRREEDSLYVSVEDDGIGIEPEKLELFHLGEQMSGGKQERKHIGISNVRDRIRYLYGEKYGMQIERKPEGGTVVILHLPVNQEEEPI